MGLLTDLTQLDIFNDIDEEWKKRMQEIFTSPSPSPVEDAVNTVKDIHQTLSAAGALTQPTKLSQEDLKQLANIGTQQPLMTQQTQDLTTSGRFLPLPQEQLGATTPVEPMVASAYALLKHAQPYLQQLGINVPIQLPKQEEIQAYEKGIHDYLKAVEEISSGLKTVGELPEYKPPTASTALMALGALTALAGSPKAGALMAAFGSRFAKDYKAAYEQNQKTAKLLEASYKDRLKAETAKLEARRMAYKLQQDRYAYIKDLASIATMDTVRDALNNFTVLYRAKGSVVDALENLTPTEKSALLDSTVGKNLLQSAVSHEQRMKESLFKHNLQVNEIYLRDQLKTRQKLLDLKLSSLKNLQKQQEELANVPITFRSVASNRLITAFSKLKRPQNDLVALLAQDRPVEDIINSIGKVRFNPNYYQPALATYASVLDDKKSYFNQYLNYLNLQKKAKGKVDPEALAWYTSFLEYDTPRHLVQILYADPNLTDEVSTRVGQLITDLTKQGKKEEATQFVRNLAKYFYIGTEPFVDRLRPYMPEDKINKVWNQMWNQFLLRLGIVNLDVIGDFKTLLGKKTPKKQQQKNQETKGSGSTVEELLQQYYQGKKGR